MTRDSSLPEQDVAEVRITAASPDVARSVAQALRSLFASTEPRSHRAGDTGMGTLLSLGVDTSRPPHPDMGHAADPPAQLAEAARRMWP